MSKVGWKYRWTEEEEMVLRAEWPTASFNRLKELLPDRDYQGMVHKASRLGIQRTLAVRNTGKAWLVVPLTPTEAAYMAGIIDGEGWISVVISHKRNFLPVLGITNTDSNLIFWLRQRIGGSVIFRKQSPGHLGKKPICILRFFGPSLIPILKAVIPYLIIKKETAEHILKLVELRQSRGWRQPLTASEVKKFLDWKESQRLTSTSTPTITSTT